MAERMQGPQQGKIATQKVSFRHDPQEEPPPLRSFGLSAGQQNPQISFSMPRHRMQRTHQNREHENHTTRSSHTAEVRRKKTEARKKWGPNSMLNRDCTLSTSSS